MYVPLEYLRSYISAYLPLVNWMTEPEADPSGIPGEGSCDQEAKFSLLS